MQPVYITKTSSFFPNEPVPSSDMEQYIGMIGGKPSRAKELILRNNGIKTRYYALDRNGKVTHTAYDMAVKALEKLYDTDFAVDDLELLAVGTTSQEMIMPSHGVQIHGQMGGTRHTEVVSFAGSCCSGMHALKYAWMAIASGEKKNAVALVSERLSAWMRANYFTKEYEDLQRLQDEPIIAFEKDFLRFMLSDGAGAVKLSDTPGRDGISLKVDWIELTSFANTLPTCMYAGADFDDSGKLMGWTHFPEDEWFSRSLFSLKQDTKLLGENIVKMGGRFFVELMQKYSLTPDKITWFLPHLSSMYFRPRIMKLLEDIQFVIPEERWFLNLPRVGNVAAASAFLMLDELIGTKQLKSGDTLLFMVPESAHFSYAYVHMTVC
ncbi:MAG: beta-ketoacyl-ACP synthase III [Bacteroidales bacterium]|jgi:3-oxoacyl-[acyl-carrier-protein] synthase-3|nr:beta-ketoacyl-ACP synthase III [Bacteroidales bacterium]MDD4257251.1 beta-ketoacyl-ACP synthase III [Bacteroidales bacterium]